MTRAAAPQREPPAQRIARQIVDFLATIPASREPPSAYPRARAEAIAQAARRKAFLASSSLALPPGPAGWVTVLPELVTIWKIQARMVADIAAVWGQHAQLRREQMLYCLFRHAASQAVRDLVVRAGQRVIVQAATAGALRRVAEGVATRLTTRTLSGALARMLPVAGALGVGAYAWYDTRQVARTAIAMFARDIEFTRGPGSTQVPAVRVSTARASRGGDAGG